MCILNFRGQFSQVAVKLTLLQDVHLVLVHVASSPFYIRLSCGQASAWHLKAMVLMVMVIPVLNNETEYISCSPGAEPQASCVVGKHSPIVGEPRLKWLFI